MTDDTHDRLGRRELLRGAGAMALLPLLSACGERLEPLPSPWRSGSRLDAMIPASSAYLDVVNAHTNERVALQFAQDGRMGDRALRRLDWLFRDWRQGRDPEIDRRVYWGLAALSDQARIQGHSGQLTLLSGYRTRRTNNMLRTRGSGAASNSYHLRRRAADIRFDGIEPGQVAEWAEWMQIGGVGRYGNFTHVDSGPIRGWRG